MHINPKSKFPVVSLKSQVLILTMLGAFFSHAAVLQNNVAVSTGVFGPNTYLVRSLNGNAAFVTTRVSSTVYEITTWVIAEEFAYYEVTQDTLINMNLVQNATPLASNSLPQTIGNLFTVSAQSPLLLGYWRDSDYTSIGLSSMDDWGWVELTEINGQLAVLRSATAVGTDGIYAGTLTTAPEPSGLFLAALAGLFLLKRNR